LRVALLSPSFGVYQNVNSFFYNQFVNSFFDYDSKGKIMQSSFTFLHLADKTSKCLIVGYTESAGTKLVIVYNQKTERERKKNVRM
jgi:hypothetical protein